MITRAMAIRTWCKECVGDGGAASCKVYKCPLWRYRKMHEDRKAPGFRLTRAPAVREWCKDCMGGSRKLVRECETESCTLHPFRL